MSTLHFNQTSCFTHQMRKNSIITISKLSKKPVVTILSCPRSLLSSQESFPFRQRAHLCRVMFWVQSPFLRHAHQSYSHPFKSPLFSGGSRNIPRSDTINPWNSRITILKLKHHEGVLFSYYFTFISILIIPYGWDSLIIIHYSYILQCVQRVLSKKSLIGVICALFLFRQNQILFL